MRIAFVDFTPWDYTPLTPDVAPLGGTQSAVCYLARQLAADGFEVSLVNGAARPGTVAGVSVVPLSTAAAQRALADCQVAVLISTAQAVRKVKPLLAPGMPLVLWTQHAADQPAMRPLAEPEVSALVDRFVFVSQWQQAGYERSFGIAPERCQVLRNAVGPAFAGLFADGRAALAAKAVAAAAGLYQHSVSRLGNVARRFSGDTRIGAGRHAGRSIPACRFIICPPGATRPTMATSTAARRRPKASITSGRCRSPSWLARCGRSTCWHIRIDFAETRASPRWKRWRPAAGW